MSVNLLQSAYKDLVEITRKEPTISNKNKLQKAYEDMEREKRKVKREKKEASEANAEVLRRKVKKELEKAFDLYEKAKGGDKEAKVLYEKQGNVYGDMLRLYNKYTTQKKIHYDTDVDEVLPRL